MRDIELSNARSVVTAWSTGSHQPHWGEEARERKPSEITMLVAEAMSSVRQAADDQADELLSAGFLPGHPSVLRLRTFASQAANEANRSISWAEALTEAEREASE